MNSANFLQKELTQIQTESKKDSFSVSTFSVPQIIQIS